MSEQGLLAIIVYPSSNIYDTKSFSHSLGCDLVVGRSPRCLWRGARRHGRRQGDRSGRLPERCAPSEGGDHGLWRVERINFLIIYLLIHHFPPFPSTRKGEGVQRRETCTREYSLPFGFQGVKSSSLFSFSAFRRFTPCWWGRGCRFRCFRDGGATESSSSSSSLLLEERTAFACFVLRVRRESSRSGG